MELSLLEIELLPIDDLIEYKNNVKEHPKEQRDTQ